MAAPRAASTRHSQPADAPRRGAPRRSSGAPGAALSRCRCSAATLGNMSPTRTWLALRLHSVPASSLPGVTCQTVDAATSAGSRSSVVVVDTNACGSAPIRRTRWARRSGSSSENTSSSKSNGGWPVDPGQQVQLGELERQDRGALLAARGERRQFALAADEHDVVAVWPDQRRAVPHLLLTRVDETAAQCVACRFPSSGSAFVR